MSAYEWLSYKGKRIIYMNLSGITESAVLKERIEIIEPVVEKEQPSSILCICDLANSRTSPESTQMLKNFTKHNQPYIKMTALIGLTGLQKVVYQGVVLFTGRKNLIIKNTKQEALEWLIEQ